MRSSDSRKSSLQRTQSINDKIRQNSTRNLVTAKKTANMAQTIKKKLLLDPTPNILNKLFSEEDSASWTLEDFEILQQLGHGKFGYVFLAKDKRSGYIVAIKKMYWQELNRNNFTEQVKREIKIQSELRHENILKLFGFFSDERAIYLILEYAPQGEIYKQLKEKGKIEEQRVADIIKQVCLGLLYLHSRNILHRDIKPQNLLLSFGRVKIADFGWSVNTTNKRQTMCGTLDYLAPQMVRGQPHDKTIDIWAIGVLCYELTVGHPPFQTETYDDTYRKICHQEVHYPKYLSEKLVDFLRQALVKKPAQRATLQQLLEHEWLKQ